MKYFLRTKPLFLFLLPVFFVFHGFFEYYGFVFLMDALLLVLVYTAGALIIAGLFWLFYRNNEKAVLITFLLMAWYFFFGSIHDLSKNYFPGAFISRYSFILPASFLFFLAVIIILKKRKKTFPKLFAYLNLLLILLLASDLVLLSGKIIHKKATPAFEQVNESFLRCDSCNKPDIYFIILDEYAGNTELKELCNFDNSAFENELSNRGFHITGESTSNYNITHFSIASTLNMGYLELNPKATEQENYKYCAGLMNNNLAFNFLTAHGYQVYNKPFYDLPGEPARPHDNFLPSNTKLITSQTFFSRVSKDIILNVASGDFHFKPLLKKYMYQVQHKNENILHYTREIATSQTSMPKFIYIHLMMPHFPYYFDSTGNARSLESLVESQPSDIPGYTGYLQYCNKKLLQLVDDLKSASAEPPVIILLGDHGFRHFKNKVGSRYYFMNLNAVYLPDKNYRLFYDSMSNVNLLKVVFNTQFRQEFPILKDSTIFNQFYLSQ